MQTEINIQTSKVVAANKLIEDIKSEKSAINAKINSAQKDLEAILDDVKRKLKISVYVENSELLEEVAKIQNQLEIESVQVGFIDEDRDPRTAWSAHLVRCGPKISIFFWSGAAMVRGFLDEEVVLPSKIQNQTISVSKSFRKSHWNLRCNLS